MTTQATPAGVRLVGRRLRFGEFVVFILDPADAAEVRVRAQWKPPAWRYRCDRCGTSDRPRCPHSLAASQLVHSTK